MNEAFVAATRSTAFTLALSHKMIETLMWSAAIQRAEDIQEDLRTRFDWAPEYRLTNFGTDNLEMALAAQDPTSKALTRRGLMTMVEKSGGKTRVFGDDVPRTWERRPTKAGLILAELLLEAGFPPAELWLKPKVPLHPDDRPRLTPWLQDFKIEHRHDRRVDLMIPGDEQWFDPPLKVTP